MVISYCRRCCRRRQNLSIILQTIHVTTLVYDDVYSLIAARQDNPGQQRASDPYPATDNE